ncbi:hypothetical protein [Mycobacterium sp. RTGN6]|uniref:hypothetical protein n=1 Tax=Mycobacterium sp. RTGN6 TaxID=3016521 RepID=UPI0029C8FAFC|nr:hypothetical protein [Mycobacterium sp. RTGN6]
MVALAALVCYGLAVLPHVPEVVAHVAGTVLCFLLVGVALASAIMPRDAGSGPRYVAIVACSLSVGVVGGLILNPFRSGLVQFGWVTFALAVTLISYGVARVRGVGGPVRWTRPTFQAASAASVVKVLASVAIVTAAIVVTLSGENGHQKTFTELWLVPDNPEKSPWHATHAQLGIKSHESTAEDFTIVVETSKQSMTLRVTLAPNEVWTQVVPVEGPKTTASVYRGGGITDQPYRTVWIDSE